MDIIETLAEMDDASSAPSLTSASELPSLHQEIPADVKLLAAVSRLLDYHQARTDSTVSVPETPETAGRHLTLALSVLQTLGRLEIENGQVRVSMMTLHKQLAGEIGPVTDDELNLCIATLATAREVRYDVMGSDGTVIHARSSDTTTLLSLDPVLRQVAMTENARLLLRVTSLRESWLYSDVDAQRLIRAIQRGQFQDIPRFCREMVRDLAAKARQIADLSERPTMADLRDTLITDGAKISTTLRDATELVKNAMVLLYAEQTKADFALWHRTSGVAFMLSNLQAELEIVLQSTESLARKFVSFVQNAQSVQTLRMPTMRFVDICRSLTTSDEGRVAQIEAAMDDVLPWMSEMHFFSPELLANDIDLSSMLADDADDTEVAFDNQSSGPKVDEPTHKFLRRNSAVIADALKDGPLAFSALLAIAPLDFAPGENQSSLVDAIGYPEVFDAEGQAVRIGYRAQEMRSDLPSSLLLASDPLLSLLQEPKP